MNSVALSGNVRTSHIARLCRRPSAETIVGACQPMYRPAVTAARSEEHTSELQSRYLVCRLLLEKKKKQEFTPNPTTTKTNRVIRPHSTEPKLAHPLCDWSPATLALARAIRCTFFTQSRS